ncbi:hypothetical protein QN277_020745 [Acacia crassicarpa]|uniref:Cystinosin homolog n=1 Tax=Acacia crassicarpa TaxID=499986 RepID=A0AAE1MNN0_9FABA|nr:hypothetical protein QN277_020745 [Acacia crassicarpa]
MASWNSAPLQVTYQLLGWSAFVCWVISFYPQVILNLHRKRVVGFSFDYALLNLTKQSSYLIYNASMYFSKVVQKQYFEKYGYGEMIPVAPNDVAFSVHAVLITAITMFQVVIYERGSQKVSKLAIGIVSVILFTAAVCFFVALPTRSWLWLVSIFNIFQACLTVIKYIPQAFMNFSRKSTDGFCIGNILIDFFGGIANLGQMVVQSVDQGSWNNFSGNIGKVLLSMVSAFYDIIFMCQHFVFYPTKKACKPVASSKDEIKEHLVRRSDEAAGLPQQIMCDASFT